MNIDYSNVYRYLDYLDQLEVHDKTRCKENAKRLIEATPHLAKVRNVAVGVGRCIYEAKLREVIGVKDFVRENIPGKPGKGKGAHKILGLLALDYFNKKHEHLVTINGEYINKLFNDHGEALSEPDIQPEARKVALDLFNALIRVLPTASEAIGMNYSDVFPIVEQQMYDYNLHLLGVPDLILENQRSKKAIVIEWKTYKESESPSGLENAQVIAYALLEASRLGYKERELVNAVSGILDERTGEINEVKVLPIIIRPEEYSQNRDFKIHPHPVFIKSTEFNKRKESYKKFKEIIGKIITVATYLSLQLISPDTYIKLKKDDLNRQCGISEGEKTFGVIYRIPFNIYHGDPKEQRKPVCQSCSLKDECAFYIGNYHNELFDKSMWALRYTVLNDEKTMALLSIFKAIYDIFKYEERNSIINKIRSGYSYRWFNGNVEPLNFPKQRFLIKGKSGEQIFHVDVIDRADKEGDRLVLYRKSREYEINDEKYRIIRSGKPVMLYLNDGSEFLSFSTNLVARVEDIKLKDDEIGYEIGVPSNAFKYAYALIMEYIDNYPRLAEDAVLIETGVDLTSRELMTIDAIQRNLRDKEGKVENRLANELDQQLYSAWGLYSFSIEKFLEAPK